MDLTTRRLRLRPVTAADARPLHALWTTPGVRRYLWDDEAIPFERTEGAIALSGQLFGERRHGLWLASVGSSQEPCGFGGLWPFRDPPETELLYGVGEPFWGRGYGTEIGAAVLRYCFESLDMTAVRASTDTGNLASIRVIEKLGFQLAARRSVAGLDTVFYERQAAPGESRGGRAADTVEEK